MNPVGRVEAGVKIVRKNVSYISDGLQGLYDSYLIIDTHYRYQASVRPDAVFQQLKINQTVRQYW